MNDCGGYGFLLSIKCMSKKKKCKIYGTNINEINFECMDVYGVKIILFCEDLNPTRFGF